MGIKKKTKVKSPPFSFSPPQAGLSALIATTSYPVNFMLPSLKNPLDLLSLSSLHCQLQ